MKKALKVTGFMLVVAAIVVYCHPDGRPASAYLGPPIPGAKT